MKEGNIKPKAYAALVLGMMTLLPALALAGPGVGQAAPNFNIPDTAWVNHQLTEYRGKVVLLQFWQAF